jgi:formate--tetrahydrofolate ligase
LKSDIEVAREYRLSPIAEIAAKLAIPETALQLQGRTIAKIDADFLATLKGRPEGKLILVTAINPTPAGEGKTTTTIGLGDGLTRIGVRTAICLREPSLGPCFGQKGGATGGGRAQVAPMDEINLHFTGDFHAITSAHNLLTAMIDNHIHWGNALEIDARRVVWRRALDMNDRALREIVVGMGGPANGFVREDGFEITVASEVMATFCLSETIEEMEERLGRMIVAYTREKKPVTAKDISGRRIARRSRNDGSGPSANRHARRWPGPATAVRADTNAEPHHGSPSRACSSFRFRLATSPPRSNL